MWSVYLLGDPVPKGSMVCIGGPRVRSTGRGMHQLVASNKKTLKPFEAGISEAGKLMLGAIGSPLSGPIGVMLTFTLTRPASVPSLKRSEPTVKPDVDKLARAVLDGLTLSGVWLDDAQVVELTTRKTYPHNPEAPGALLEAGTLIQIWRMPDASCSTSPDQPALELEEPRL